MTSTVTPKAASIYEELLGVKPIIQASGTETPGGGTLMAQEVVDAMAEAAKHFVVISELNAAVGKKIAEATGAEAGYVTAGSASAMLLAAAACITGTDPAKVRRLPNTDGMANEIIIHRMHRITYDQMFQAAGGRLVEIGIPAKTEPWELEAAITEKTACAAYVDSPNIGPGALDFPTFVDIAHRHGIPVVVDAASTLPPVSHLRRWIDWGVDLVVYSGGKGIRGPQNTGLLAGRADLIAAAAANGSPNIAIGRAAKVSKEAMVGLAVALDLFLNQDHDREFEEHKREAELIHNSLASRDDVTTQLIADQSQHPAPMVMIAPAKDATWTATDLRAALLSGEPRIYCRVSHGRIGVRTHSLQPGDAELIAEALHVTLDRMRPSA